MPDEQPPPWLKDHDEIIRIGERHTALVTTVEAGFLRMEKAADAAQVVADADRRALWAAVNELRRNGGWKGKSIQVGIPTGVASLIAGVIVYLLTGRPMPTQAFDVAAAPAPAAVEAPGPIAHNAPRATP